MTITESPAEPEAVDEIPTEPAYDREAADLLAQVPDSALAYFEFKSLDSVEELVLRSTMATGLPIGAKAGFSLGTLPIASVGIDPSRLDHTAPIALAYIPVPGGHFPAPILMVPALDDGPLVVSFSALANRGLKVRRIEGGYAVVEPVGFDESTARGGSALTENLKDAAFKGSFDTETFLPMLEYSLQPLYETLAEEYRKSKPRGWTGPEHSFAPEDLADHLRESEQVRFGFDMEGDRATLSLRLVDINDTAYGNGASTPELRATLKELSHHLDIEGPASFVTAFDPESAVATLRDLWDRRDEWRIIDGINPFAVSTALEEDARNERRNLDESALDSIEKATLRMLSEFQPGAAVTFQMEPSSGHLAIYLAARNPERAREAISLLLSKCDLDTWGFEMALPIRSMMDGTLVEDYNVRFDTRRLDFDSRAAMRNGFKTYLGDSSLHLKVASVGRHVLVILGGDTSAVSARIRSFSDTGLAQEEYVRAADSLSEGNAATIGYVDLVQVFGQLSGIRAASRGLSAAENHRELKRGVEASSAPFFVWESREGHDSLYGATFDMLALKAAIETFGNSGF